jgi:hypothetical protein
MPEHLFTKVQLINTLRKENPQRYKYACDVVANAVITEYSEDTVNNLGTKLSQRYNIEPEIAKVYVDAAIWSMINSYLFDAIKCRICNDTGMVKIAPNARGVKACVCVCKK